MIFPWKSRRVTFERFMDFCLYDPVHGYYSSKEKNFGPDGDYYTSPYTHPFFAQSLAEALASYFKALGQPRPFDLVELGAGKGILGRDVLAYLKRAHPTVFDHLQYHAVEIQSPGLPSTIQGVVFSNEFFDALPVHRVRVRGSGIREIYVRGSGEVSEMEGKVSNPRIVDYMKSGFRRWKDGCEYEVNLRMVEMLHELESRIECGFLLTIDYGYEWEDYEVGDREAGTLMCYHRHQAVTDPYFNIGQQDITAHVNFDIMKEVGTQLGWVNQPLKTQRRFLMDWGLEEKLLEEERYGWLNPRRIDERLQLKTLLSPGGISDTMKVLVQGIRATPIRGDDR